MPDEEMLGATLNIDENLSEYITCPTCGEDQDMSFSTNILEGPGSSFSYSCEQCSQIMVVTHSYQSLFILWLTDPSTGIELFEEEEPGSIEDVLRAYHKKLEKYIPQVKKKRTIQPTEIIVEEGLDAWIESELVR